MKRWAIAVLGVGLATATVGGDLKSVLSPDRPEDRAVMRYLELAEAKTATAADLTELGVLLTAMDRLEDAEHWLQKAVKLDKHSFAARYRLGLVQQRQGRCDDAARSFARALDDKLDDPYARFMLALAQEKCGSSSGAVGDYARAYAIMPALANAETNPLVLDSHLQTEAALEAYRLRVGVGTFSVDAVDPAAVKAMTAAFPPPTPTPVPATPTPLPPLPAAEAIAVPPAATPTPPLVPPPGAPGGGDPSKPPSR
jgi:hypothetical protein